MPFQRRSGSAKHYVAAGAGRGKRKPFPYGPAALDNGGWGRELEGGVLSGQLACRETDACMAVVLKMAYLQ